MSDVYAKTEVLKTEDGVVVYDYSIYSYAIKTTKEWMNNKTNSDKLKLTLQGGKYNPHLKDPAGEEFKGWYYNKKKNPLETIEKVLNE